MVQTINQNIKLNFPFNSVNSDSDWYNSKVGTFIQLSADSVLSVTLSEPRFLGLGGFCKIAVNF